MLAISPQDAIAWGRQEHERDGALRIHFNFGDPGCLVPHVYTPCEAREPHHYAFECATG